MQRAFTLLELLVVIAIIGVLAAILLPVFGTVRKTADKVTCQTHLKQIVTATNLAANENNGNYPDMRGFSWEPNYDPASPYIANVLAPYVGGTADRDPTKLMRCPAAEKNQKESWLQQSLFCHYRYNVNQAQNTKPKMGYSKAMLFFDVTYHDWTTDQASHFAGSSAIVNVAYADGHTASVPFKEFATLDPADDKNDDLFALGWTK